MKTKMRLFLMMLAIAALSLNVSACDDDDDDNDDGAGDADADADTDVDADTDADADSDADTGVTVAVSYGGSSTDVDLSTIETIDLDGVAVVPINEIIKSTNDALKMQEITVDFEGSDGYRPSETDKCADALPIDGSNAKLAGIDLADENSVVYDATLEMPGCAGVKDVGVLHVADK
jgi:hypothetical protein